MENAQEANRGGINANHQDLLEPTLTAPRGLETEAVSQCFSPQGGSKGLQTVQVDAKQTTGGIPEEAAQSHCLGGPGAVGGSAAVNGFEGQPCGDGQMISTHGGARVAGPADACGKRDVEQLDGNEVRGGPRVAGGDNPPY
eukprot:TRINITY_DN75775_c0_g1_i1.p2 TRINITY_DN75775_c0_g1~~TRINITY_DN75775_c0_g1_i1.p2  ORF type:complete len:141 (-),score=27.36 TRINITY_DN75775_c0_g1_i1:21-443(-)